MRKAGPDEYKVKFKARLGGGVKTLFKSEDGDRFVIWGKASVEVVDKEGDKITGEALKEALPQLLRRKRLSVEHSDQLVGDILESFETDEPVTVEIDGKEYTRTEFPTGVLKIEDEEPALFVAGEVWDDTKQARQAREDIETGDIDSYSISGEAITSSTQVKDGDVYDKITELDLSAVTLCEEGMNQKAKFGTVVKMGSDEPVPAAGAASSRISLSKTGKESHAMSNEDNENEDAAKEDDLLNREDLRSEFKSAAQEALDESDFATMKQVEEFVKEQIENEDASMTSEDGGEPAFGGGEDEEDEEDDDDEEEKSAAEKAAEELAAKYDVKSDELLQLLDSLKADDEEEEVDEVDPDDIEDPDGDGEEEMDIDPTVDDDLPPEDPEDDFEEEEKGDVVSELKEAGVPDDLLEAVKEYVGDEEEEPAPDVDDEPEVDPEEEEEIELEDDDGDMDSNAEKDDEPIGGDDLDDLSKMDDDEYLTATAGSAVTIDEDEDLSKSFDIDEDDVVEKEGEATNALDAFYESVGEEPTAD